MATPERAVREAAKDAAVDAVEATFGADTARVVRMVGAAAEIVEALAAFGDDDLHYDWMHCCLCRGEIVWIDDDYTLDHAPGCVARRAREWVAARG